MCFAWVPSLCHLPRPPAGVNACAQCSAHPMGRRLPKSDPWWHLPEAQEGAITSATRCMHAACFDERSVWTLPGPECSCIQPFVQSKALVVKQYATVWQVGPAPCAQRLSANKRHLALQIPHRQRGAGCCQHRHSSPSGALSAAGSAQDKDTSLDAPPPLSLSRPSWKPT